MFMKMKDLCAQERPREKMLLCGAKSLSTAELLAILIGSGIGGKNAVDVAQELLIQAEGQLGKIAGMSPTRIAQQKGIGKVRALSITAALELGRRFFEETAGVDTRPLTSPDRVFRLMLPRFKKLDHEECWLLMLNKSGRLIGREMVSSGGDDQTIMDVRQILRKLIEKQASSVILTHNHPVGSASPSEGDIRATDRLRKALQPLGIPLLDHVIVADNAYFSFAEDRTVEHKKQPSPGI